MVKYYLYTVNYELVRKVHSLDQVKAITGSSKVKIMKNLDTKGVLPCGLRVKTSMITKTHLDYDSILTVGDHDRRKISRNEIIKYLQKETCP